MCRPSPFNVLFEKPSDAADYIIMDDVIIMVIETSCAEECFNNQKLIKSNE